MYDGFVELIRDDGARVYVNPHQVAYFEPHNEGTKLYLSTSVTNSFDGRIAMCNLVVRASPYEVLDRFTELEYEGW